MASKYLDIIADIKAKLSAIADIGKVHDYERWSADPAAFIEIFSFTVNNVKHIRGWEILRTGFTEHKNGAFFRHHRFQLKGYMGVKDASATEKDFQTLIENICEAFRVADGPEGSTWDYRDGDEPNNAPVQAGNIEARQFGNILCHTVTLNLSVTERIVA